MAWVEKHFLIAANQKIFYCFFECCNNNNSNKNTTKRASLEPAYNWLAHLKLFKLLGRFEKNVKSFSVHSTVKPLRCQNFFVVLAMDNFMSLSSKWMDWLLFTTYKTVPLDEYRDRNTENQSRGCWVEKQRCLLCAMPASSDSKFYFKPHTRIASYNKSDILCLNDMT